MTSEQLEQAARKLCTIRGLDPDKMVDVTHPQGYAIATRSRQWAVLAQEIQAITEVLSVTATPKKKINSNLGWKTFFEIIGHFIFWYGAIVYVLFIKHQSSGFNFTVALSLSYIFFLLTVVSFAIKHIHKRINEQASSNI